MNSPDNDAAGGECQHYKPLDPYLLCVSRWMEGANLGDNEFQLFFHICLQQEKSGRCAESSRAMELKTGIFHSKLIKARNLLIIRGFVRQRPCVECHYVWTVNFDFN